MATTLRDETRYDIITYYERQGYTLPAGVTAADVVAYQRKYELDPIMMPLVSVRTDGTTGGVTAWGVPFIDGKPLRHP